MYRVFSIEREYVSYGLALCRQSVITADTCRKMEYAHFFTFWKTKEKTNRTH